MTDQVQSKEDGLREALRAVIDPEIGMNIVELGLIRDFDIAEDRAHVTMIMTTPFCPYAPQLLEQTRRTAQEYLGVPTTIARSWSFRAPATISAAEALAQQLIGAADYDVQTYAIAQKEEKERVAAAAR